MFPEMPVWLLSFSAESSYHHALRPDPELTVRQINFDNVYGPAGYKDVKNAKVMFGRVLEKIQGGKDKTGSPKPKAAAKPQGITKQKAPAKGRGGRPKKVVQDQFAEEGDKHDKNGDIAGKILAYMAIQADLDKADQPKAESGEADDEEDVKKEQSD